METYHKIQTLFKRDMDGSLTGKKGKMIRGSWSTPELEYLADKQWEFTEKVDGTNIRIGLNRLADNLNVEYAGRSDNAVIPEPLLERLEEVFPTYPAWRRDLDRPGYGHRHRELLHWMQDNRLEKVVLFGEGYGPKIQNGGNYRSTQDFVLFDVKIGDFWLDRANVDDIASKLGIDSVPVIGYGTLYDAIAIVENGFSCKANIKNVNRHGEHDRLISTWGNFEAEGIVARPMVPLFNRKGERIITKIKGVDFK